MVVQNFATTCLGCILQVSAPNTKYNILSIDNSIDENDALLLCSSCVHALLQSVRERHQLAKETWYESRSKCVEHFRQQHLSTHDATTTQAGTSNESTIRIYERRYQELPTKLEAIQQDCSRVAMETCALNLCIIEGQESISTLQDKYASQRRHILSQLQKSLCGNCDGTNIVIESDNATDIEKERRNYTRAFINSIEMAQATVRTLRFHWSLQVFTMFHIQVEDDDMFRRIKDKEQEVGSARSKKEKTVYVVNSSRRNDRDSGKVVVSGIGKICGLPIPHAGMELYGVLPCEELRSALRLVAQLTHMIARCFNIRLPHPIVIAPPSQPQPSSMLLSEPINQQQHHQRRFPSASITGNYQDGDIANLADLTRKNTVDGNMKPSGLGSNSISVSLTSLSSLLSGGGNLESRSTTWGPTYHLQHIQQQQQNLMLLSMDPKHVEDRISYATSAVIAEDQSRKTFYKLSTRTPYTDIIHSNTAKHHTANNTLKNINPTIIPDSCQATQQQRINDEFAIALQLLQNDILMICMNAGVPIDQLYPGEALLLNLYALQLHCFENM